MTGLSGRFWNQGWSQHPFSKSDKGVFQKIENDSSLLSKARHRRQPSVYEQATSLRLDTKGDFSPAHRWPQCALGTIVGRLDSSLMIQEGPHGRPSLEKICTKIPGLGIFRPLSGLQHSGKAGFDTLELHYQIGLRHASVEKLLPETEDRFQFLHCPSSGFFGPGFSVFQLLKILLEMSPTELPQLDWDFPVGIRLRRHTYETARSVTLRHETTGGPTFPRYS